MVRMERLLEVKDLAISFRTRGGEVQAIRGVNFHLDKGETLAIVGESGSGKSVTSQAIMKLVPTPQGQYKRGQILFEGQDLIKKSDGQMQKMRGKEIGMIFQDPMTSLNPTMKVGKQITEVLFTHEKISGDAAKRRAIELLTLVGIPNPEKRYTQYPHEFSGGMRQRVVIAMALAANPKLLIADEPTTALDVTIQAQILELMKDLQAKIGTAIIFITHDLGVVAKMADRVAVMYAGQIVEMGTAAEIFYDPRHPYTWGLLSSMPSLDSNGEEKLTAIPGTPPDLLHPPVGDAFALRSNYAMKIDFEKEPPMFKVSDTHFVKSWLLHPDAPAVQPPEVVQRRLRKLNNTYETPVLVEA
ncbi:ABC transporter ATP-binding protein [Saccharibacillus sp. CPCC 101409]|uniref:ABC transporter ATP-binding protein n=1 Tax=Saccharibacillus sp. CPCC 101409 TaxID=3058041 RepID=UPI002672367B|nr:ABC transporter ATP-binding protein [Saccharibacillus sp. CPCC 101409]MDO3410813.1 ABC transporter ATP-binding protein [Saccharibacillus sp. CPCC 101409]